jgi:hypothetical protein
MKFQHLNIAFMAVVASAMAVPCGGSKQDKVEPCLNSARQKQMS